MSNIIEQHKIWYHVNYSNDLFFNGKTTRFLRVAIPPSVADIGTPYINMSNYPLITTPRKYWCTLVPVLSYQNNDSTTSILNMGTPEILSQYMINGVNATTLYKNIYSDPNREYDCFNLYGVSSNNDINNFFGANLNAFNFAAPSQWQKIEENQTYEYRIDYLGETDELIKFIFFISEYQPINGKFKFPGNLNGYLLSSAPYPSSTTPNSVYSQASLENGVKSINHFLFSENTFTNISDTIALPYDSNLRLPLRIDYIDIDIFGKKFNKKTHKINTTDKPIDNKVINDDVMSHMMLRTNPMLSGNIKLTVDNDGDIWLNSIDANNELSNSRFKKYKINSKSSYAADLYKFLDNGAMPSEILYDVYQYDSTYQYTKNLYNLEYDNFYNAGAQQLKNKFYSEEFSFFAPLWLKKQIPEFFVVFKVDHPLSKTSYDNFDNKEIIKDVFENAMIIKTFDLRKGSKIGDYLHNIISGARYKTQPLFISYQEDSLSTWNGVAYENGVITERGEYLYDIFTKDRTIKEFEDYITSGFKRNKIISQNLINLEFLFNDDVSDEYSINRYFGFYINEVELDKFNVSDKVLSKITNQIPNSRMGIDVEKYSMNSFYQTNSDGIKIPIITSINNTLNYYNDINNVLSSIVNNKERFFAIKNRASEFKRIKTIENKTINYESESIAYKELTLYDTQMDITQLTGIDKFSTQLKADLLNESSAQMVITLYDENSNGLIFQPGEVISITWDNNVEHHEWNMIANETGLQPGDCWDYPVYNPDTYTSQNTFNPTNGVNMVAQALSSCINKFDDDLFRSYSKDNKIFIITTHKYDGANLFSLKRELTSNSIINNMKLYDIEHTLMGTPNNVYQYNFIGGNTRNRNRAKIDIISGTNIESNDWFQTNSLKYSQIKTFNVGNSNIHILPYLDEPVYNNAGKIIQFKDIDKYVIIEMSDEYEFYTTNEMQIVAYKIFQPSFSVLSTIPIKDFDVDFYFSDYAYSPVGELLKYFDFYTSNTNGEYIEILTNQFYKIIEGTCELEGYIDVNGWSSILTLDSTISDKCLFNTIPSVVSWDTTLRSYSFLNTYSKFRIKNASTAPLKIIKFLYSEHSISNDRIIKNLLDEKLIEFSGFYGLNNIYNDDDEAIYNEYKLNEDFRRFTYPMLNSEYDRLLENNLKDYVLKSRVVPYINKWVNIGTDVRDNKYRLNLSNAFGITGYTPSHDTISNPEAFTHEWYYLDRHPEDYPMELFSNSRSYMFESLDEIPFTTSENLNINNKTWKDLLYHTQSETDFFTKYFTVGYPNDYVNEIDIYRKREERYVYTEYIEGLEEVQCLFRGARIKIKELDEFQNEIKGSQTYRDYKFSAILTLKQSSLHKQTDVYDIEVIDNRKFKTITFVITFFIQDYKFNHYLSYSALYTAFNALKNDTVFNDIYENIINPSGNYSPIYDMQYDYSKQLGLNYVTINDYKDIEVTKLPTKTGFLSYIKDYGFIYDEFQKIDAGSLENAYSLLSYPIAGFKYGKILSFEGFLSLISINDKLLAYPEMVKLFLYCKPYGMQLTKAADISRLTPFYPASITYDPSNNIQISSSLTYPINSIKYVIYDENINLKETNTVVTHPATYTINGLYHVQNYLLNAGANYNVHLLEELSFSEIKKRINKNDKLIKYKSIDKNGLITDNLFQLEVLNTSTIIKTNILRTSPDNNKPNELLNHKTIGFKLETSDSFEKLLRYNGTFEPKTKDVILFNLNEDSQMIDYFNKDFILLNTHININNNNNAIIKNLSINKINPEEILKVTNNLTFFNLYPLIDQISIDNKDHNIMLSSWDNNFYREYITKSNYINKEGLIDMQEIKTFFGSKAMNVKNVYSLDVFNTSEYTATFIKASGANIGTLSKNQLKSNIQTSDDGIPKLNIFLNIEKRLIRKFKDENVYKEFNWVKNNVNSSLSNLSQEQMEIIVDDYLQKNIINLYEIDNILIYSKIETRIIPAVLDNTNDPARYYEIHFNLTESEIINEGYVIDKTTKFEVDAVNSLKIVITSEIDTNTFKKYAIVSNIKRI